MKGNTERSIKGQVMAFVAKVVTNLPRIGTDLTEDRAQELITHSDQLNALLWKALATRHPVSILHRPATTLDVLKRIHIPKHSIDRFVVSFPIRTEKEKRVELELMRFDQPFFGGNMPYSKAIDRGFTKPEYEDALFTAEQTCPLNLWCQHKDTGVIFLHEPVQKEITSYLMLRATPINTWRLEACPVDTKFFPNTWFAFRSPSK